MFNAIKMIYDQNLQNYRNYTIQKVRDEFEVYDELVSKMEQLSDRTFNKWVKLRLRLKRLEKADRDAIAKSIKKISYLKKIK